MKNSAVLLISCPDRKGIVAAVSDFLYRYGANITDSDQHQDSEEDLFLMRVAWDMRSFDLSMVQFEKEFLPIAKKFHMDWSVHLASTRQNVAIFVSKEDHCLADLLYRHERGELDCNIKLIVSNHNSAKKLAAFYSILFYSLPIANKKEAEKQIVNVLKEIHIDLIILARYMQILSKDFVKQYTNRIINIHHSFLPAFIGARPYHQAFERGVKIIGATAHFVTADLDEGPIIEQDVVRISHKDTVEDLVRKGRDLERVVLSRAVRWYIEHRILQYSNKTVIFE